MGGWNFSSVWGIDTSRNSGYAYLLTYQVTYNGNSNDVGDVPTDYIPYSLNSTVSVIGNTGNLTRAGYIFSGWNTSTDGSGTDYAPTDKFEITTNTTLYAKWISNDALLRNLTVDQGTLTPAFTSSDFNYTVGVANHVRDFQLYIETTPHQTLMVTQAVYTSVTDHVYNYTVSNLVVGPNVVDINVTALDGIATNTYTVTVNRASPTSTGGSSSTASDTITSTDGHLILPAGQAGKVSLEGLVTLSIPAGATDKELELTIEQVLDTESLLAGKEMLASPVFEFLKSLSENFLKPVTITLVFDPTLLESNQTVGVFYYDEKNKAWVEVTNAQLDNNQVSVEVDHFTKFAVLVIDKTTGLPVTGIEDPSEIHFSDITGHWAESFIIQALNNEISEGYPDSTFRPDLPITRVEFTVMLMKALGTQVTETVETTNTAQATTLTFTDAVEIGNWAQRAVSQALQAGIIQGYEDNTFRPNTSITRAEMAVMIANALSLSVDANTTSTTNDTNPSFADEADIPAWAKEAVEALKQLGVVAGRGSNNFAPHAQTTRAEAVTVLINLSNKKV